jgi:colicin import membrane protein
MQTETSALALISRRDLSATEVFKPGGVDDILRGIAEAARAHKPDISTRGGRAAIASIAYKVAQSKTLLDDMGKDLVAGWKKQAGQVDAERRRIREFLDSLRDEVRKPLDDYEAAEAARIAGHERALAEIRESPGFYASPNISADLRARLEHLRAYPPRDWQEFALRAEEALAEEIGHTEAAIARAERREAEQAELERLQREADERRRQEEERQRQEREAQVAAEAAERARLEAEERAAAKVRAAEEQAAAERRAAELADQERRAAEARAAEEREAAERARQEACDRARRAEEERIAAEKRAEERRAAAVEAERRRLEAARAAEEEAAQREAARRAADQAHRAQVNREALAALKRAGLTDELGRTVIAAIVRGDIPHVSIAY